MTAYVGCVMLVAVKVATMFQFVILDILVQNGQRQC